MLILVSNDDGYNAPGLEVLRQEAARFGTVVVVAPEQNQSGTSNALTLNRPLFVKHTQDNIYFINGTPADCVHIALTAGILDRMPDLVLSGINNGANLGSDTLYSGTVAAATEAHLYGVPAIAFSLAEKGWGHLETARLVVRECLSHFLERPLPQRTLLNINIPNVPLDMIRGQRVVPLGARHLANPAIKAQTPYGETVYWIGSVGAPKLDQTETDFSSVHDHYVTITPLQFDLTDHTGLSMTKQWADSLCVKKA